MRAELVTAFRAAPATPVLSPSRGELVTIGGPQTLAWDLVAATWHCLGRDATPRDRETRLMVLTWARVTAQGGSLREACREREWAWVTFETRVGQGMRRIADTLEVAREVAKTLTRLMLTTEPTVPE